jgi:prepilin-type N-terminal cleavage/methylation domain-containing protein
MAESQRIEGGARIMIEHAKHKTQNAQRRVAFTLIELLVVIAILVVLMAILFPTLNRAREAGRRAKCMGNLRQMQMAWHLYAVDNGDRIVNGQPSRPTPPEEENQGLPWLIGDNYLRAETAAQAQAMMQNGVLAKYVGNTHVYLCPSRYHRVWSKSRDEGRDLFSSYHIVASMNVWSPQLRTTHDQKIRASHEIGKTVLFVIKTSQLVEPGPSSRMVFVDQGSGSWMNAGYSAYWGWGWDDDYAWPAPVQHSNGTCLSFADGHVDHWTWKDPRTLTDAKASLVYWDQFAAGSSPAPFSLESGRAENEDYVRIHTAVWGKGPR